MPFDWLFAIFHDKSAEAALLSALQLFIKLEENISHYISCVPREDRVLHVLHTYLVGFQNVYDGHTDAHIDRLLSTICKTIKIHKVRPFPQLYLHTRLDPDCSARAQLRRQLTELHRDVREQLCV